MNNLGLYKFYWYCGRMGNLEGMFIASKDVVSSAIGKEVYFGEVLGKHSDISGTLEADDIKLLTDDIDKISIIVEVFGLDLNTKADYYTISGYNPLAYLKDEEL